MRLIKLKILFLASLTFILVSPGAAQQRVLTVEDAVNIALKNNRELKIAELAVKKADAAVKEAFGYALPSVDIGANYYRFLEKPKMPFPDFAALLGNATYSILFEEGLIPEDNSKYKPVGTTLQSFVQTNNFETSIQATQVLFNSAVLKGIGSSQIYLDLSKENLNRTIATTVFEVQKGFYLVLLSKELYEITEASFNNSSDNLRNVKALYDQGLVSEFDYLQAEVRVENIRPVLLEMENILKMAKDRFKVLLGMEQSEEIDVEGEFTYKDELIPDEDEYVSLALKENYDIKTMELKLQLDDAFIELDRADYWPSLAAFANYSYAGSGEELRFQTYNSATIGLNFSMNIFRGTRTKNKVEQSQISLSQSREQYEQLKDLVVTQVKMRINELRKVKASLQTQEKNVSVAQRAYDLSVLRYKEGTGSQLEVQNSDVALRQARVNRLQSIYDFIISTANLNQLLGRVDPSYLKNDF